MKLPFYISMEKEDVREIIESTFSFFEAISDVRIPRKYVGNYWNSGEFGSLEWYIRKAYNPERKQVNLSKLWELLENEPWQNNGHYELIILESDIYAPETNFVFGETRRKISNDGRILPDSYNGKPFVSGVIISRCRMRRWYDKYWKYALSSILTHEIGHFFGLPSSSSPNFITEEDPRAKCELDIGHCNDRKCIMEQVNIKGRMDLLEKTMYIISNNPSWFCEYDLKSLKRNIKRLYKSPDNLENPF